MNPIEMFKLARAYEKFNSIEKGNAAMNSKILQIGTLAATLFGTLGVPELATNWLHAHLVAYSVCVAVALVLHAVLPSVFSGAPSDADKAAAGAAAQQAAKTGAVMLLMLGLGLHARAQTATAAATPIQNLYAAGVSYNGSAAASVAGTGLYAHLIGDTGTYAFTAVDAIPASYKPFTVTSNIGVGVAQRIATIGKVPVFVPTAIGVSWTGANTGWQWSGGVGAAIPIRNGIYIVPTLRFLKSSVSNGSGYQPIVGVLFGWGK